ncbi:MAG: ABC transporter permease [Acidimicrobiia bacterium]
MSFAAYWFRATFRNRWRSYLGIVTLLGVTGGLSLFALAGARRTQSAYPRFLREANASTMAVDTGTYDAKTVATIASFPEVVQSRVYVAPVVGRLVRGKPVFSEDFEALASLDGRFFDQDRFTPTHGRLPDPKRIDEIAVNETAAKRFGYRVGQKLDLGTWDPNEISQDFFQNPTAPKLRMTATVVGIGLFPEEVVQDDTDRSPLVLFTPAYTRKALPYVQYEWQGLVLKRGDADVDAVKQRYLRILDAGNPQFFRVTSVTTFHTQQAVRPLSIALTLFGAIAFFACLVLVGLGLSRQLRSEREERAVLRAMGAAPGASSVAAATGPLVAVLAGAALAIVLAVAASPFMPIGKVRAGEVAPGLDADWTVLGLGALLLCGVLGTVVGFTAWRVVPHRLTEQEPTARPSKLVAAAQGAGLSPAGVAGLRLAMEPGRGRTAVPVRSVMLGVAIAVLALVAATTFGSSLNALVDQPRLFGWAWDATLVDSAGYGQAREDVAHKLLDRDPNVDAWAGAFFGTDTLDGTNVPLLGMTPGTSVHPPILTGRTIESARDVVLGSETLRQLHKHIGDTLIIGDGTTAKKLRIVGTATLPTIGTVHGAYTSLGVGAMVDSTLVPGYARSVSAGAVGPNVIFVRFRDGVDHATALAHLRRVAPNIAETTGEIVVVRAQRPAEIVNASDIGSSPTILAGALVFAALASLALTLGSSVRRRRHDLALLKTLGFTRRQLAATVRWQASVTVAVGLLVGVPVGIIAGRWLWGVFARGLDVVPEPSTPFLLILAISALALLVGILAAAIPARVAQRVRPARILRTE